MDSGTTLRFERTNVPLLVLTASKMIRFRGGLVAKESFNDGKYSESSYGAVSVEELYLFDM